MRVPLGKRLMRAPVALVGLASCAASCDRDASLVAQSEQEKAAPAANSSQPLLPRAAAPPEEAAPDTRPSTEDNMGRRFQGQLQAEISVAGKPQPGTFRYFSDGDRARMQLSGLSPEFDVLIVDDRLTVLNHSRKTYRSHDLEEIQPVDRQREQVKTTLSGQRSRFAGLVCNQGTQRTDDLQIDLCVRGLPGTFDVGKFEKVTGIRVPDWIAGLTNESYIPVVATAKGPGDDQRFHLAVTQYSPDPAPEQLFQVPATYTQVGASE